MATTSQACLAGAGVALILDFVCRDALASGELERVLPDWSGPATKFYLVYPERKLLPRRVRLPRITLRSIGLPVCQSFM
jgi:DNA-binding transcriptional LysR family regulator